MFKGGVETLEFFSVEIAEYLESKGYAIFWYNPLPWCDGRCVQGPGTYSPWHSDPRLLAIPTSWSRVADSNPDYDALYEVRLLSRGRFSLYMPL